MSRRLSDLSRRTALLAAAASALAACGQGRPPSPAGASGAPETSAASLDAAIAGDWRSDADKARDRWRHPAQTLAFWGLKPGQTVVEFWPGAGWYTDIIAPYLAANGGKFYAAQFQVDPVARPAEAQLVDAYAKRLAVAPALYGQPVMTTFGATSGPVAPPASADLVIFADDIAYWMAGGMAEKAFHDAYAALKPGGVLGVEESRAAPGGVQDALAPDGYVQEAYVKGLAQEAGFTFQASSEINANPKDVKAYPFGVWTLPPWRQSAAKGKPDDPFFQHGKFDAIGEPDRMTLRFVRPG
ncbi:MAG TPA: methyltransferase [Caulobacteraceae bacterium]|nr:methyltransferase [Caulobacteraceae bacterium]